MKAKNKGSNAERELVHVLWSKGYAAIRVAGSGSIKYPVPDVLAANGIKRIAIECKASGEDWKYIEKREVHELMEFAIKFGAEPYLGIKFNNLSWRFFRPEEMKETEKSFMIKKEEAKEKVKKLIKFFKIIYKF